MSFLKKLPNNAGIGDVYREWQDLYRPWMKMGQELMKGGVELAEADRELIATYVSVLNGCDYCKVSHVPTMEKLGVNVEVIDQLSENIDTADIEERLKILLKFCKKLTLKPDSISKEDAEKVIMAGWSEEAFHTAVGVTCRFNYMNRLTLGLGLMPLDDESADFLSSDRLEMGYDMMDKGGTAYRSKRK